MSAPSHIARPSPKGDAVRNLLREGRLSQRNIACKVGCDAGYVSRLAREMGLRPVSVDAQKSERITMLILGLGELSAKNIAMLVGTTDSYVHQVASRVNAELSKNDGVMLPKTRCVAANLSDENWLWLAKELTRTGASVGDLLNAIVTDARYEERGE